MIDRIRSACGLVAYETHRIVVHLVQLVPAAIVMVLAYVSIDRLQVAHIHDDHDDHERDDRDPLADLEPGQNRIAGSDEAKARPAGGADIPGALLGAAGFVVGGVLLDRLLLSAADPVLGIAAIALGATLGVVTLIGWRSGYLVFRPGRALAPTRAVASTEPVPVRVTGALPGPRAMVRVAGEAVVRAMPAFARDAKGRPESPRLHRRAQAVIGRIGRDGRALGSRPSRSEGVLVIVARDGRAGDVLTGNRLGSVVPGTSRRFRGDEPALMIEPRGKRDACLVLSFETEEQRGRALAMLAAEGGLNLGPDGSYRSGSLPPAAR